MNKWHTPSIYLGLGFGLLLGSLLGISTHFLPDHSDSSPININHSLGIKLSLESHSTSSQIILTGGRKEAGVTLWGEVYMQEAGFISVETIEIPLLSTSETALESRPELKKETKK